MPYSTFHVPGIDAGVSLALDGDRLALCLMAKGRARNKDGSYSKRNPDRRALLLHLLSRISTEHAHWLRMTHSKGGASASPWNEHQGFDGTPGVGMTGTLNDMRAVYSKAGNFRVDYHFCIDANWVRDIDLSDMAAVLGLEPADTRRPPRDVRFFRA